MRLASFNVENLFARAKAMDTTVREVGEPALAAFERFNRIAGHSEYTPEDRAAMLDALVTLGVLVQTRDGRRLNPRQFDTAWALLRENRGDFLAAPADKEPHIVAAGRGDWTGWVELITEPVDEVGTRMTARVIRDVGADVICLVEAENRPALVRFNDELLGRQYEHAMLVDGNDPRGIDVGLLCTDVVDIDWVRSHVDVPDPAVPGKRLFSRDCPLYKLRLPGGQDLYLLLNHLKSQSFASGDPDPLRTRQSTEVRAIYDRLRAQGAQYVAVLGDFNKGPDRTDPKRHPTLEALLGAGSPLVSCFDLDAFGELFDPKDADRERPGTFQSCTISNRLDYILLSPELAAKVTGGGVFRKGLWGSPANKTPPKLWSVYPEITAAKHAASDHAAVWVDLDLAGA
ncbi:endonuclease/exonuclease/phosphatase family protein [Dactylosporangium vinaceum]|uniref:Endonuclease/exonuclease/phosphatase family protein n=1 Tax=Dactylosporangium vinaceum TaxID=53362 RepID=A0ABV5M234_9ACTN|nr:endonuclease/exonuclease/phosphatase family protein [Dactylosporangium vinaceum]UAB99302.1 endonuclease/exonuclease/phosphatase family protein [Dactylosporangium vinaceum]